MHRGKYILLGALMTVAFVTLVAAMQWAGGKNEAWMLASTIVTGLLAWGGTIVKGLKDDE